MSFKARSKFETSGRPLKDYLNIKYSNYNRPEKPIMHRVPNYLRPYISAIPMLCRCSSWTVHNDFTFELKYVYKLCPVHRNTECGVC